MPIEHIQHSFEHYGRMILKLYGPKAYQVWRTKIHAMYGGETRPHVCTKTCKPD